MNELKAEGIGLRLCLRKFGVRVLRRAAAAASANMTTNPHLKLTKGDTHPTSGVKGGLPARFKLAKSGRGTPQCCQCSCARRRKKERSPPAHAHTPVGGAVLHRTTPTTMITQPCA